jgi:hypothetical protein
MDKDSAPPHHIVARYQEAFREHGRSEAALLWTKNKQSVRFAALCRDISNTPATLLDYGCGLGDLGVWLREHRPAVSYLGADAVPEFIDDNRATLPDLRFAQVSSPNDLRESFDHVVCSGVFNLNPGKRHDEHWSYVQAMLSLLFARTRRGLHVDFLAHDVDYKQDEGYHQDVDVLIHFVEARLSRRYRLDRTYMPFEYCISIFKDVEIDRPRNIYRPIP